MIDIDNKAELESQPTQTSEFGANPEALASPEAISLMHEALGVLIDNVPEEFVWNTQPNRGAGDIGTPDIKNIRLMSLPCRTDESGKAWGEAFVWVNYMDNPDGQRQIMITEDQGSANPWGDVMGSLAAGAIVRKITRYDTAFLSPTEATVRRSHFTFGPAELEKEQNAAQVRNPFEPITNLQMSRLEEIMINGSVHSHNGDMVLPPMDELETIPIADILLQQ